MEDVDPQWYDGYFEREYLDLVALRIDPERTRRETDFIVGALELEPGVRILDLACGHGRISLELARRGFDVVGVDLSERSLQLAREAAKDEGLSIEFRRSDMRKLAFTNEFDAVINIFTAFGYFLEERENQRVLDAVERALKPGGTFLIDHINGIALWARYRPNMWEEVEGTEALFLQEHQYDLLTGRNAARWLFVHPDGTRTEISHSVRIYAPHELLGMLEAAGLAIEQTWGDFEGAELTRETWRQIVRSRKPTRTKSRASPDQMSAASSCTRT